jgi:hypothetical protein
MLVLGRAGLDRVGGAGRRKPEEESDRESNGGAQSAHRHLNS